MLPRSTPWSSVIQSNWKAHRRDGGQGVEPGYRGFGDGGAGHERHAWVWFNKLAVTTDPLTFDTMKTVVVRSLWFSPLHTLRDYTRGTTYSEQLGPQARTIDEWAEGTRFATPFFVVQGAQDVMTPPANTEQFVADVTAPLKEFVPIDGTPTSQSRRKLRLAGIIAADIYIRAWPLFVQFYFHPMG